MHEGHFERDGVSVFKIHGLENRSHAAATDEIRDLKTRVEHLPDLGFTGHRGLALLVVNGCAPVIADLVHLVDADDLDRDVVLGAALDGQIEQMLAGLVRRLTQNRLANFVFGHAAMNAIAALHDEIALVHHGLVEIHLDGRILTDQTRQHGTHVAGGCVVF